MNKNEGGGVVAAYEYLLLYLLRSACVKDPNAAPLSDFLCTTEQQAGPCLANE